MDVTFAEDFNREIPPAVELPVSPSSPAEFINLMAHYHRAEIARMAGWRDRIDRTTNWAITMVAAMLSVSLSSPTAHHGVMLFGMLILVLLLMIEARRYRFFDVYRNRVRQMERNYYAQILAPRSEAKKGWTRALGEDLRRPIFLISLQEAMSRRLQRNYCWMFIILLFAWALKITSPKLQTEVGQGKFVYSLGETLSNAVLGPLPGWLVLGAVATFYGFILYATLRSYRGPADRTDGNVHV